MSNPENYEDDYEENPYGDQFSERVGLIENVWTRILFFVDPIVAFIGDTFTRRIEYLEGGSYRFFDWVSRTFTPRRWRQAEPDMLADMDQAAPPELDKTSPMLERFYRFRFAVMLEADRFFESIGEWLRLVFERIFPRRFFWPIYWLFARVPQHLGDVYDFGLDWWLSRNYRRLLLAVPAVTLLFTVSAAALLGFLNPKDSKIRRYETLLQAAQATSNESKALLVRMKLDQLGHKHLENLDLQRAFELAESGEVQQAYEEMKLLAPLDSDVPGLLQAHLWIVGSMLDGLIEQQNETTFEVLNAHIDKAVALDPKNHLARRFRIEVCYRQGDEVDDDLLAEMELLAKEQNDLYPVLAHEYRQRGDTKSAVRAARAGIRSFENKRDRAATRGQASSDPSEGLLPIGYIRLAESYMLVGDLANEEALLREGLVNFPEDEALAEVAHERNQREFSKLDLRNPKAAELAEAICQREPDNRNVALKLVLAYVGSGTSPDDVDPARAAAAKIISHLEAKQVLHSNVYLFCGDYHLIKQQSEQAAQFYKLASELDPEAAFAFNNLAAIWSSTEPLRLDDALKASNRAIDLSPDPRFYDTRGQILVKLERWEDAVKDLEIAVSGSIPNLEDAHRGLVTSYEALGKTELAAAHRQMLVTTPNK